jgi:trimethylamine:corrinoid methyltransferase-like protein
MITSMILCSLFGSFQIFHCVTEKQFSIIIQMIKMIYAPYYESYIKLVEGKNIIDFLADQQASFNEFLYNVPFEKYDYAYASEKWTVKQVVGHIIDTERIMATRLMCIARGEQQALPGYDDNSYVENSDVTHRSLSSLAIEFQYLRKSNVEMITEMSNEALQRVGNANNHPIQALALVYIIAGHLEHHWGILKSRYLELK